MGRKKLIEVKHLKIDSLEHKGKGVGKHEGMVVFVEQAAPGDVVSVIGKKKKRRYLEAKITELESPSPHRTEPFCQHFDHCGGCKYQHVAYEEQVLQKAQIVAGHFRHLAALKDVPMLDPLACTETKHYRNKLEFSFSSNRWLSEAQIKSGEDIDRRALGFHVPGRFDRVEHLEECFLMDEPANAIRNFVFQQALELDIPFYQVREHRGILRNLMLRLTRKGDLMVLLQVTEKTAAVTQLMEALKAAFPEITSLLYIENQKQNDTIFDQKVEVFAGQDYIEEVLLGKVFKIRAKSFFQTNTAQAEKLYEAAIEAAGLTGQELVYDLYTGTGSIALCLADKAKKVVGVEYIEDAIADAKLNAEANKTSNCAFFAGDMKEVLNDGFIASHGKPDVVVTDPPRAGMHADVVQKLLEMGPERIVYVSCNPATQARDIELLSEQYRVEHVRPVDMFPQTPHIESVALLVKQQEG